MLRQPMQTRSRQRVNAILDAAADILAAEGYGAMSTNRVAKSACVSIGSVYQYFGDKEDIFRELMKRHTATCLTRLQTRILDLSEQDLNQAVELWVEGMFENHQENPALMRAMARYAEIVLPDLRDDYLQQCIDVVAVYLRMRQKETSMRDPDMTAFILVTSVNAIVSRALRSDDFSPAKLKIELIELITKYLSPIPQGLN